MDPNHPETRCEFWHSKFEIILLTLMVILFIGLVVFGSIWKHDSVVAFAIDNNKTFAGALLMALTGRAIQRNGDRNGNGGKDAQPSAPSPASTPAGS